MASESAGEWSDRDCKYQIRSVRLILSGERTARSSTLTNASRMEGGCAFGVSWGNISGPGARGCLPAHRRWCSRSFCRNRGNAPAGRYRKRIHDLGLDKLAGVLRWETCFLVMVMVMVMLKEGVDDVLLSPMCSGGGVAWRNAAPPATPGEVLIKSILFRMALRKT